MFLHRQHAEQNRKKRKLPPPQRTIQRGNLLALTASSVAAETIAKLRNSRTRPDLLPSSLMRSDSSSVSSAIAGCPMESEGDYIILPSPKGAAHVASWPARFIAGHCRAESLERCSGSRPAAFWRRTAPE